LKGKTNEQAYEEAVFEDRGDGNGFGGSAIGGGQAASCSGWASGETQAEYCVYFH
jgi:hypothetical protein